MARVQCGQGAVRSERMPEGVDTPRIEASGLATARSTKAAGPAEVPGRSDVEAAERIRQPQCAQKLWFVSRSLVRPQLAQRATGFVLARKSVRDRG